ncbi:permease [Desertibacillus haloalkaliphilus]|uniref:permease n=1 Tax=Desertibacillus haloalkaliphilus TaxID=1328930 RepID=UPI001C276A2E|nr:permease [Desertibacillus haloalkaliphilus]MBU8908813.1 permease [Desertibacillus haloalkaliphilus]
MKLKESLSSVTKDLIGLLLLIVFLILFFNIDYFKDQEAFNSIPQAWLNVNTIFLSIVIEAIPFILLGVFFSSLIQIYVSEETIQRYLPRNALSALVPAAVLGAIFPICECAIVPVVRRLIKKGMPLHIGVVFLVAAPILNPIVAASTYFAFRNDLSVLYSRMGLAFVLAILIGAILYLIFKNSDQLKWSTEELIGKQKGATSQVPVRQMNRFKQMFYHASDEFFLMGKYLIAGAFIASLFQTFLDRNLLAAIGSNEWSSTAVMMAFAFLLSLCSEADAFVASSFGSTFTTGSIIAFLVYGPMLDLKNTVMLFAFFKAKFVITFMITVTVVVFVAIMGLQFFIL